MVPIGLGVIHYIITKIAALLFSAQTYMFEEDGGDALKRNIDHTHFKHFNKCLPFS